MIGKITTLLTMITLFATAGGDALYKKGAALYETDPAQALDLFKQATEEGNISAMVGVGHCYESGIGTATNFTEAIKFYEMAAKQNSLKGCEGLARIYASCPEPEFHDGEKAVKFAGVVVRKRPRDAEALAVLASAYARNFEFKKAVDVMRRAQSKSSLGLSEGYKEQIKKYGNGTPYPEVASEQWIEKAEQCGSLWALLQLAQQCADSGSSQYDLEKAEQFYMKAGRLGYVEAYDLAGEMYFEAGGTDEAYFDKALEYFQIALDKGFYGSNYIPEKISAKNAYEMSADDLLKAAQRHHHGCYSGTTMVENPVTGDQMTSQYGGANGCKRLALFYYRLAKIKGSEEAGDVLEGNTSHLYIDAARAACVDRGYEMSLKYLLKGIEQEITEQDDLKTCASLLAGYGYYEQAIECQRLFIDTLPEVYEVQVEILEEYRAKAEKADLKKLSMESIPSIRTTVRGVTPAGRMFAEAHNARQAGQDDKAFELFVKSYDEEPSLHNGKAAYQIAGMYWTGNDAVKRDMEKAWEWRVKAVDAGYRDLLMAVVARFSMGDPGGEAVCDAQKAMHYATQLLSMEHLYSFYNEGIFASPFGKKARFWDVIAAAYARSGDFENAIEYQNKALELLSSKDFRTRNKMEERLALYKTGTSYTCEK
jgi:TPR repeat protein